MKKIFCLIPVLCLFFSLTIKAQEKLPEGALYKNNLPKVYIDEATTIHFISPEHIKSVDISTNILVGDIGADNVFRLKLLKDRMDGEPQHETRLGVVSIIGEKFIAQYSIWFGSRVQSQIEILPKDSNPLNVGEIPLSINQLRALSVKAMERNTKTHIIRSTAYGLTAQVNNIYAMDDYIFIDVTYINLTNLKYDIDLISFRIEDKKITKATNVQAVDINPVFKLNDKSSFKFKYRDVYVLKKFTFPNNKILSIELVEKQISGRTIKLQIDYSDLLNADTL